jgi:hypothetical protein
MGLLEFHVFPSFLKDRFQWKDNFTLLGRMLTSAPGGPKPALWFHMYALQMLFSQHKHPVLISPVYGCLIKKDQHDFRAYPHVPSLKRVQWFPGLRDLEAGEYPSSLTVNPIPALDTAMFAQKHYVTFFRCQPWLPVIGDETEVPPGWLDGYCASKALCVHHGADACLKRILSEGKASSLKPWILLGVLNGVR